jgi:uncharacterized HAD superfamily protein
MQTLVNKNLPQPSLLRQIVDEVDGLTEEQKLIVLQKAKWQKILAHAKKVDEMLNGAFPEMTEEEIWDMCSQTRKEIYEEKLRQQQTGY